jgi:hypothetical protein
MLRRAILFWIPMVFIAILNGIIRNSVYQKYMGELTAHQISAFTAIILFGIYIWFIIPFLKLQLANQAFAVGLIWLVLTIAFEFIFGHFVVGHPWSKLFADYNLFDGRLWILVLLWVVITPYFAFKLHS